MTDQFSLEESVAMYLRFGASFAHQYLANVGEMLGLESRKVRGGYEVVATTLEGVAQIAHAKKDYARLERMYRQISKDTADIPPPLFKDDTTLVLPAFERSEDELYSAMYPAPGRLNPSYT